MTALDESTVEQPALDWFADLGYSIAHGPDLAPGEPAAERDAWSDVVLVGRLRDALRSLNPAIPEDAREEARRKVLRPETPSLTANNRRFHAMLRDGVEVGTLAQRLALASSRCSPVASQAEHGTSCPNRKSR